MYKKDVPPVFEPEERFLSILKGNRMRPATVGAQGASVFASILVDNDGIASVIAFVEYFVLTQVDAGSADVADVDIHHRHLASVSLLHHGRLCRSGRFGIPLFEKRHDESSLFSVFLTMHYSVQKMKSQ